MKLHLALILALLFNTALGADPPPLFSDILDASQPTPPRALASFPATVNFAGLDANLASLTIDLPGVGSFIANRVAFQQRPGGGYH